MLLNGFKVAGDLKGTGHDMIYVGNLDMTLAETQVTLGDKQEVPVLKGLEQNNRYDAEGEDKLSGRLGTRSPTLPTPDARWAAGG